jgi:glycosyltransferase involved in cell wall biosynthesis
MNQRFEPDVSISVLIPNKNYGQFLKQAIDSVLGQGIENLEVIIVDGGSIDSSLEILKNYKDKRIKWYIEPELNQAGALNYAMSKATHQYVAWLNSDEFFMPFSLKKMCDFLKSNPLYDLVYGDVMYIDTDGNSLQYGKQHNFSRYILRNYGPYIPTCSTVFRRETLDGNPMLDDSLKRIMDWDLYLRLSESGFKFAYLPICVASFRVHPIQITSNKAPRMSKENICVRERYRIRSNFFTLLIARSLRVVKKSRLDSYLGRKFNSEPIRKSPHNLIE